MTIKAKRALTRGRSGDGAKRREKENECAIDRWKPNESAAEDHVRSSGKRAQPISPCHKKEIVQ